MSKTADRASGIEADNKRGRMLGEVLQPRTFIFGILGILRNKFLIRAAWELRY